MVAGGLWLCLWRRGAAAWDCSVRVGALWAVADAAARSAGHRRRPHLAVSMPGRRALAILRDRAGDYVRAAGREIGLRRRSGQPLGRPFSACSHDSCIADSTGRAADGACSRPVVATQIDWLPLTRACAGRHPFRDRRLPRGCVPRWLKPSRCAAQPAALADQLGEPKSDGSLSRRRNPRGRRVADRVRRAPVRRTSRRSDARSTPQVSLPAGSMK